MLCIAVGRLTVAIGTAVSSAGLAPSEQILRVGSVHESIGWLAGDIGNGTLIEPVEHDDGVAVGARNSDTKDVRTCRNALLPAVGNLWRK
jgi:hypothetical protein